MHCGLELVLGMGRQQLARKPHLAGTTSLVFIITARMKKMMHLLRMSNHTVQEIADLLGYVDAFTFNRQFKAKEGTSPTTYRKA